MSNSSPLPPRRSPAYSPTQAPASNQFRRPNGSLTVDLHTGAQRTHRRAALGVYFICPARSRRCRVDGRCNACVGALRDPLRPRRSPAYSPSSPAVRGSVAPWPSFADRLPIVLRRYALRYELLLFGRRLTRAAPKSHFAPPYAVLADKSRLQSIESRSAFPAPYTTLRPSRPFEVILVTAEALRFVERRRGRRSAIAPPPNPAPPYAVLADVGSSVSTFPTWRRRRRPP